MQLICYRLEDDGIRIEDTIVGIPIEDAAGWMAVGDLFTCRQSEYSFLEVWLWMAMWLPLTTVPSSLDRGLSIPTLKAGVTLAMDSQNRFHVDPGGLGLCLAS